VSQADPRRTVVIERHDKSVRNSDNTDPGCYPARWRETTSATGTFVVIGAHMQPLHDSSVIYEGFRFPAAHPQSWVLGSRRVQQPGGGDPRAHHLQALAVHGRRRAGPERKLRGRPVGGCPRSFSGARLLPLARHCAEHFMRPGCALGAVHGATGIRSQWPQLPPGRPWRPATSCQSASSARRLLIIYLSGECGSAVSHLR